MPPRRVRAPIWAGSDLLLWAAAIAVIGLSVTPVWAPVAEGRNAGGAVRNVAPMLSLDASTLTMRAFDANGEGDLFALVLVTDSGANATISLPAPAYQGVVLEGRDVYVQVRDARAPNTVHSGALDLAWTMPRGAPAGLRTFAIDHAGAVSDSVAFPSAPLRPSAQEAHAERIAEDGPATTWR